MHQAILSFLLNALLSAVIGLTVGLALQYTYPLENSLWYLSTSILAGISIGTASKFSSGLIYHFGMQNIAWSYVFTFVITLVGCLFSSFDAPLTIKLTILAIAEPLALLAVFLNIRYALRLNDNLKRKQASLKQEKK